MRGTTYAIGEIIVFLALAGLVGVAIGLLIGWPRQRENAGSRDRADPELGAATQRAERLEARLKELESAPAAVAVAASVIMSVLGTSTSRTIVSVKSSTEEMSSFS